MFILDFEPLVLPNAPMIVRCTYSKYSSNHRVEHTFINMLQKQISFCWNTRGEKKEKNKWKTKEGQRKKPNKNGKIDPLYTRGEKPWKKNLKTSSLSGKGNITVKLHTESFLLYMQSKRMKLMQLNYPLFPPPLLCIPKWQCFDNKAEKGKQQSPLRQPLEAPTLQKPR